MTGGGGVGCRGGGDVVKVQSSCFGTNRVVQGELAALDGGGGARRY